MKTNLCKYIEVKMITPSLVVLMYQTHSQQTSRKGLMNPLATVRSYEILYCESCMLYPSEHKTSLN